MVSVLESMIDKDLVNWISVLLSNPDFSLVVKGLKSKLSIVDNGNKTQKESEVEKESKVKNELEEKVKEVTNDKKIKLIKKVKAESEDLEDSVDEETDDDEVSVNVDYSFHEEKFITDMMYGGKALDYEQMFYGGNTNSATFEFEEEYWSSEVFSDTDSETMETPEAEATMMEIQYNAILGATEDLDFNKRKKFANWVMFNPALLRMFESMYSVTGNVNYSAQ